jgi:predicted transcriptional regulator
MRELTGHALPKETREPNTFTIQEFSIELGMCWTAADRAVRKMISAGMVEPAGDWKANGHVSKLYRRKTRKHKA